MNNRELALYLGRVGYFVFPCVARGDDLKKPLVAWSAKSTTNRSEISQMWLENPGAIPAIDCGKSGIIVIDCDRKQSNGLLWLESRGYDISSVPGSLTPGGGRHLYYRNQCGYRNGRGQLPNKLIADIDVKGVGGCIIAPGAIYADGRRYEPIGDIRDAVDLPEWAVELLRPYEPAARPLERIALVSEPVSDYRRNAYGQAALDAILANVATMPPGGRQDPINKEAFNVGRLVGGGFLSMAEAISRMEDTVIATWGGTLKPGYLGLKGTIQRAIQDGIREPKLDLDEKPIADVSGLLKQVDWDPETGEVIEDAGVILRVVPNPPPPPPPTPPDANEIPEYLLDMPGLLKEIIEHVNASAIQQQSVFALGTALMVVGTACGRQIAGPTKSGTHLYLVGLGPSGSGKDHYLTAVKVLMLRSCLGNHVGPSEFISMPSVINFVQRAPLSACVIDEFGAFLKRINSRKASGFEASISKWFRSLWSSSFKPVMTPEWAGRETVVIYSPAMSVFGMSTPDEFYAALEGGDVVNGAINRSLLLATSAIPRKQKPVTALEDIPQGILDGLARIYYRNVLNTVTESEIACAYDLMTFSPEAEMVRDAMELEIKRQELAFPVKRPFLARTAENAIRLATIRAVGCQRMEVEEDDMVWGRDLSMWSTGRMAEECGLYIADSETQAMSQAVKRALKDGVGTDGWMRRRDLKRTLRGKYKRQELENVIADLLESGVIEGEQIPAGTKGGKPGIRYAYRG